MPISPEPSAKHSSKHKTGLIFKNSVPPNNEDTKRVNTEKGIFTCALARIQKLEENAVIPGSYSRPAELTFFPRAVLMRWIEKIFEVQSPLSSDL